MEILANGAYGGGWNGVNRKESDAFSVESHRKALAAHRGGTKTILIPKDNAKDVREIPMKIRREMTIIPVEHVDEVLRHALVLDNPDAFFRKTDGEKVLEAPGNTPSSAA